MKLHETGNVKIQVLPSEYQNPRKGTETEEYHNQACKHYRVGVPKSPELHGLLLEKGVCTIRGTETFLLNTLDGGLLTRRWARKIEDGMKKRYRHR